jgi:threonyl-tRNA synthetase
VTVGEKEEQASTLAIRTLDGKVKFGMAIDEFVSKVKDNVQKKKNKMDEITQ